MTLESYNFIEHFDYLKNYVPQPFYIPSDSVLELVSSEEGLSIKTNRFTYSLSKASAKKLVDSLGIKIKLFNNEHEESSVIDQILPAINKLFKCFADCFVFYNASDSPLDIIDLNVNSETGEEGTKYENGPSPWQVNINNEAPAFTCFANFTEKFNIPSDSDILIKADDIMTSALNVNMNLFRPIKDSTLQPMLSFSGKSSNMNGFTDIKPVVYDSNSGVFIKYPVSYNKSDSDSFDDMWDKVLHLYSTIDLDDFISREMNELAASNETPGAVKSFISTILVENTLNINQPISMILTEAKTIAEDLSLAKARTFKNKLGTLIGWCLCRKHSSCHECGHLELER